MRSPIWIHWPNKAQGRGKVYKLQYSNWRQVISPPPLFIQTTLTGASPTPRLIYYSGLSNWSDPAMAAGLWVVCNIFLIFVLSYYQYSLRPQNRHILPTQVLVPSGYWQSQSLSIFSSKANPFLANNPIASRCFLSSIILIRSNSFIKHSRTRRCSIFRTFHELYVPSLWCRAHENNRQDSLLESRTVQSKTHLDIWHLASV